MINTEQRFLAMSLGNDMGASVRLMFWIISSYVAPNSPSYRVKGSEIFKLTGLNERAVRGNLAKLKTKGYFEVEKSGEFYEITLTKKGIEMAESCPAYGRNPPSKRQKFAADFYIMEKEKKEREKEAPFSLEKFSSQSNRKNESDSTAEISPHDPSTDAYDSPFSASNGRSLMAQAAHGKLPAVFPMGKNPEDWEWLFNWMMKVIGKPQVKWGEPMTNKSLTNKFEDLRSKMLQQKWWPSPQEFEAVEWRYEQPEASAKRTLGGHRLRTDPLYFISDFYDVATECENEWKRRGRHSGDTDLEDGDTVEKDEKAFLDSPMEDWTQDQLEKAIKFGWGPPRDELVAERKRRAGQRRMEAQTNCNQFHINNQS